MLDLREESVMTLKEAAKVLPRRRRGRKPHVSTLHRWASQGLRGVVLETLQVGGTRCTSSEALMRFFLAVADRRRGGDGIVVETPRQRERAIARATAELKRMGV